MWSVRVELLRSNRLVTAELMVILQHDFPLSLPKIVLQHPPIRDLGYPLNVGADGNICILDPSTTIVNPEAPGEIVEACVRRAIRILEQEADATGKAYEEEFIAHWEGRYLLEPPVDTRVLSLIPEDTTTVETVTYVRFHGKLGLFHAAMYSDPAHFHPFAETLQAKGIAYETQPTFYLGELTRRRPPLSLQHAQVHHVVTELGFGKEFQHYVSTAPVQPIITFSTRLHDRHLVFGWRHTSFSTARSGSSHKRKPKRPLRAQAWLQRDPLTYVERFSPQVLTRARLQRRTAADYAVTGGDAALALGFVGVGSVGSQLIGLLASLHWREIHLVDPDVLTLENLARHLLGMEWVGRHKIEGMRDYLLSKNPLGTVQVEAKGIVDVVLHNSTFVNACDALFVCTGDANAELWLSQAQRDGSITCPLFFLWVEPYVAGGHCVYLNGQDGMILADLFDNHYYRYNVIPQHIHEARSFVWREVGCQTSYLPFDNAPLTRFLHCLFPEIVAVLRAPDHTSCRLTWVGDLEALQQLDISAAHDAKALGAFQLERVRLSCRSS
jgi:hypothetical protein